MSTMSSGSMLPTKPALPFTFQLQNNTSSLQVLTITITNAIKNLDINKVSFDFSSKRSFTLNGTLHRYLQSFEASYFLTIIKESKSDGLVENGIIFSIYDEVYGIIKFHGKIDLKKAGLKEPIPFPIQSDHTEEDLLSDIVLNIELQSEPGIDTQALKNFSMRPPEELKKDPQGFQNITDEGLLDCEKDPGAFLRLRYFSSLYSLKTPLTYFPKTSLARLRVLNRYDSVKISECLKCMCFSVEELDSRYLRKFDLLDIFNNHHKSDSASQKRSVESYHQNDFVKKNIDLFKMMQRLNEKENMVENDTKRLLQQKFNEIMSSLKVREGHLQFILLLELLCTWNIDEADFLTKNQKRQDRKMKKMKEHTKQSLVKKKNSKTRKRIVPTLLGMGVNLNDDYTNSQYSKIKDDEYLLYVSLNALIDRMNIWDTLSGRSSSQKDSSIDFLAYVIVPYFKKRIPVIVKFVIDKFKNSDLKIYTKVSRSSKDSKIVKPVGKRDGEIHSKIHKAAFSTNPKRVEIDQNLSDGLLPAISLRRSKSNLSSKNFSKRQVDMSFNLKQNSLQEDNQKSKRPNSNEQNTQSIFGSKKPIVAQEISSMPQISETPRKKSHLLASFSQIAETPVKASHYGRPEDDLFQVNVKSKISTKDPHLGSPINSESKGIFSTPRMIGQKENFLRIPDSIKKDKGAVITASSYDEILSSPLDTTAKQDEGIVSDTESISKRRPRPGDPISVQSSPYYNTLNNSRKMVPVMFSPPENARCHDDSSQKKEIPDSPTKVRHSGHDKRNAHNNDTDITICNDK